MKIQKTSFIAILITVSYTHLDVYKRQELPSSLPILPLRNTVLFPGVVIPITAGRDKSIKLINEANAGNKIIGVVAQKNEEDEDPSKDDIHHIGTCLLYTSRCV